MKETVLGLGIILLFAGVIVLPMSIQSTKTPETRLRAEREFLVAPNWTISAQLNESEEMLVYFSRPNTGEQGPVPNGETPKAYMFVEIIDPVGGNTTFNVSFTRTAFTRIVDRNDGGLIVKNPQNMELGDVGGKTQYTGEYKVRVYTFKGLEIYYYTNGTTMRRLEISTVTWKTEYPNIAALPVSVSLAVVGLVLAILGARSPKRRVRTRKA